MHCNRIDPVFICSIMVLSGLPCSFSQNSDPAAREAPPRVYADVGACPFECCTYREWTVEKRTTVFDRPNGKRVIMILSKGQRVSAPSGEVISKPVPVRADRDIPDTPVRAGDTFYVLHYDGEGVWEAWFRGKKIQVDEGEISGSKT